VAERATHLSRQREPFVSSDERGDVKLGGDRAIAGVHSVERYERSGGILSIEAWKTRGALQSDHPPFNMPNVTVSGAPVGVDPS